ncbi:MAG TPA: M14 family zinc carboxypeptidase [Pirellulales bacterium]|nr:M14 family zinc carboxypeptidase [Pirellulales bacterium]
MVGRTHQFSRFFLLIAGTLTGICGRPNATVAQPGTAPPADRPLAVQKGQPEKEPQWSVLGRSVEDRVIEYRQFGQGEGQVLVVGPLEGDATPALELLELLANHLTQFPRRTDGVRVTLVRDPNPDGRLRRSPYNARGVLLDQNFPTRGWHKIPSGANWLSGREPESEPETRLLVDLIDDVRPDRVILLAATHRQAELTYFGAAEDWAREFAKAGGLRPAAARPATRQGSLAVYASDDRKTPTLVLRMPAAMRSDQLWTTYKRALLAAVGGEAEDSKGPAGEATVVAVRQPAATLATAKGKSPDAASRPEETTSPRAVTADELDSDGDLVPVVRPPAMQSPAATANREAGRAAVTKQPAPARLGTATSPSQGTERTQKPLVPYATPYRENGQPYGAFPPASLFRPNATVTKPAPSAPSKAATSPKQGDRLRSVDRLPPVDRVASPPPKTLPQPIPLYPETGY